MHVNIRTLNRVIFLAYVKTCTQSAEYKSGCRREDIGRLVSLVRI